MSSPGLEVPKLIFPPLGPFAYQIPGGLISFRIDRILNYLKKELDLLAWLPCPDSSVLVTRWHAHMDEWTKANGGGTTVLVLHKPRMPIGACAVVISYSDYIKYSGGPMDNSLVIIAPSSDTNLALALNGIQATIYQAAERNLDAALAGSPSPTRLTMLERSAIIEIEALKLTNGIDLAALLIRGRILRKIREQNLLNVHPEHFSTLAEMASAQGISSAELPTPTRSATPSSPTWKAMA